MAQDLRGTPCRMEGSHPVGSKPFARDFWPLPPEASSHQSRHLKADVTSGIPGDTGNKSALPLC